MYFDQKVILRVMTDEINVGVKYMRVELKEHNILVNS